jgi:hypothetical protein
MAGSKLGWKILVTASTVGAGILVRKAIETAWEKSTGKPPPRNPESPETTWAEAIAWAMLSAVAVAAARLLATRQAAQYWRRSTGSLPPGLEEAGA